MLSSALSILFTQTLRRSFVDEKGILKREVADEVHSMMAELWISWTTCRFVELGCVEVLRKYKRVGCDLCRVRDFARDFTGMLEPGKNVAGISPFSAEDREQLSRSFAPLASQGSTFSDLINSSATFNQSTLWEITPNFLYDILNFFR